MTTPAVPRLTWVLERMARQIEGLTASIGNIEQRLREVEAWQARREAEERQEALWHEARHEAGDYR